MTESGVNTRELVERIWSDVATEQLTRRGTELDSLPEFEPLVEDDERSYLNSHLVFDRLPAGAAGHHPLKRRLKARGARFVVGVLERYFDDEQEFIAHLVRLQNRLTVEHDRLSREVRGVHDALRAESERLGTVSALLHARLEERIAELEHRLALAAPAGEGPA